MLSLDNCNVTSESGQCGHLSMSTNSSGSGNEVSCDWRTACHVTSLLTSDWSAGLQQQQQRLQRADQLGRRGELGVTRELKLSSEDRMWEVVLSWPLASHFSQKKKQDDVVTVAMVMSILSLRVWSWPEIFSLVGVLVKTFVMTTGFDYFTAFDTTLQQSFLWNQLCFLLPQQLTSSLQSMHEYINNLNLTFLFLTQLFQMMIFYTNFNQFASRPWPLGHVHASVIVRVYEFMNWVFTVCRMIALHHQH